MSESIFSRYKLEKDFFRKKLFKILLGEYAKVIQRELKKKDQTLNFLMAEGNTYKDFLENELKYIKNFYKTLPKGDSFFERIYKENVNDFDFEDVTAKNLILTYKFRIEHLFLYDLDPDFKLIKNRVNIVFKRLVQSPDDLGRFNLQEGHVRDQFIQSIEMSSMGKFQKEKARILIERQSSYIINYINELFINYLTENLKQEKKLKEEILNRQKEVNLELERAKKIQENLLPKALPIQSGLKFYTKYLPMTSVGGDFYDIVDFRAQSFKKNSRDKIGVIIADVSGHGIPAAFIASMAKMSWKNSIERLYYPSLILNKINQQLLDITAGNFITIFIGVFEQSPASLESSAVGRFIFSSAGHPPPYVIRKNGKRDILESKGRLLGVFPDLKLEEKTVPYFSGDRFIFYTDGLLEARNNESRMMIDEETLFGYFHESGELSGEEATGFIIQKVSEFTGNKHPEDDITLLIVDVD
ncbi:MAG: serine/threonine-protein phosphatase [Leptospiraceae bacterium]|nr:serine/threonine-protein phosphatase [Leptospiraceae bacterium]